MCFTEKSLSHEENASSVVASISYVCMPINTLVQIIVNLYQVHRRKHYSQIISHIHVCVYISLLYADKTKTVRYQE